MLLRLRKNVTKLKNKRNYWKNKKKNSELKKWNDVCHRRRNSTLMAMKNLMTLRLLRVIRCVYRRKQSWIATTMTMMIMINMMTMMNKVYFYDSNGFILNFHHYFRRFRWNSWHFVGCAEKRRRISRRNGRNWTRIDGRVEHVRRV